MKLFIQQCFFYNTVHGNKYILWNASYIKPFKLKSFLNANALLPWSFLGINKYDICCEVA